MTVVPVPAPGNTYKFARFCFNPLISANRVWGMADATAQAMPPPRIVLRVRVMVSEFLLVRCIVISLVFGFALAGTNEPLVYSGIVSLQRAAGIYRFHRTLPVVFCSASKRKGFPRQRFANGGSPAPYPEEICRSRRFARRYTSG